MRRPLSGSDHLLSFVHVPAHHVQTFPVFHSVSLVLITREFICEVSLVDRIGQEKSHACLSRYQVSFKKGFEGALIISSHLSRWPQQPSLWPIIWWTVDLEFVSSPLMSSWAVYSSFQTAMLWCFSKGNCVPHCSLLVSRDEKLASVHIFIPRSCNINNETGNLCKESHLVSSTLMQWPKVLKCNS